MSDSAYTVLLLLLEVCFIVMHKGVRYVYMGTSLAPVHENKPVQSVFYYYHKRYIIMCVMKSDLCIIMVKQFLNIIK